MNYYPPSIRQAIQSISKLPGIGEKTAERLAMHLLRAPRIDVEQLARSLLELKSSVRLCEQCFGLSDAETCEICSNPARDPQLMCVVEQPADMVSVEKSGAFSGRYHILGGSLSPINGVGPDDIRIRELMTRIAKQNIAEIILATSTTVEGESTAAYIADRLKESPVIVTRIASGVPVGGDLKYVDQVTLKRALEGRHAVRKK
ncbi:MAG: recombination mediator RecR [Desulfobacterales bacterium]|jgi:recombination protein RecR